MADKEMGQREIREESVNSGAERAGPSDSQASTSKAGPSTPSPGCEAAGTSGTSEGKTTNYFAALDSSVEVLQSRAQTLIDKINEGRTKDQTMMKNFNTNLNIKVADVSRRLETRMYTMYEQNNAQLEVRLQELTEVIERIRQLQDELKQVCDTVVTVYEDLGLQHS